MRSGGGACKTACQALSVSVKCDAQVRWHRVKDGPPKMSTSESLESECVTFVSAWQSCQSSNWS